MIPSLPRLGGYLWKIPYKMGRHQKARMRSRLKAVDNTIANVAFGLQHEGLNVKKLNILDKTFPKESEMPAKDKYWVFARYARNYRKGAHRQPKFTKISNRTNPLGF